MNCFRNRRADRIAKRYMPHDSVPKKGGGALRGAVDELIGNHELGRLMLQLERTDSGDGDDPFHTQLLHGEDIGAEVDLRGKEVMAPAMAGQKNHLPSLQLAGNKHI